MIASVSGRVISLRPDGVVVAVGGVGLALTTTPALRARARSGDDLVLSTSLVVREDSLTLFGFAEDEERDLFELLQTGSGVGPKLALAVLSVYAPVEVRRALLTEDLSTLQKVPGIGRKGAQRLVLELKDKVGTAPSGAGGPGWRDTLAAALAGLGFAPAQIDEAVTTLAPDSTGEDVPALLKKALLLLGPKA